MDGVRASPFATIAHTPRHRSPRPEERPLGSGTPASIAGEFGPDDARHRRVAWTTVEIAPVPPFVEHSRNASTSRALDAGDMCLTNVREAPIAPPAAPRTNEARLHTSKARAVLLFFFFFLLLDGTDSFEKS